MPGQETKLVKQALDFLRFKYPAGLFWRNNTGGVQRTYKGKTRHIAFGVKGASDILGVLPGGQFLAAEAKTPIGRASKAQAAYIDLVNMAGGVAFVFRDLDGLDDEVRDAMEKMTWARSSGPTREELMAIRERYLDLLDRCEIWDGDDKHKGRCCDGRKDIDEAWACTECNLRVQIELCVEDEAIIAKALRVRESPR